MSAQSIEQPYPIFTDADGDPLENGYIWIGVENLYPITNPVAVYWDAALTQPAVQPIRTQGGYPVNAGTPARLYTASSYSILVQHRSGIAVYSAQSETALIGSDSVTFLQAGSGAVTRTAQSKMRESVSVKDFGAVGDGVTDDTVAIQAAMNVGAREIRFPAGTYKITAKITWTGARDLVGDGPKSTELLCQVDDWTFDNPLTSGRSISVRGLKLTGDQTKASNAGIRVFDNGDRPFRDLEINGFSRAGLRVVQSVNPVLENIRAYNCATSAGQGAIEIDPGVTATVSPQLSSVYISNATNGLLLIGTTRNLVAVGLIIETCTTAIRATNADGVLIGGWLEANTTDFNGTDATLTRVSTLSTVALPVWSTAWSGTPTPYRMLQVMRPGFGGVYNSDDRVAGATATWTDVLFASSFDSFAVSQIPFAELRVLEKGLYRLRYSLTFRDGSGTAVVGNARLTKEGVEIPGSYVSVTVPANAVVCVTQECIVDCADDDDIKVQFSVSSLDLVIGKATAGVAAPTHATNATLTAQFLMAEK
jgi:hypothetical protein